MTRKEGTWNRIVIGKTQSCYKVICQGSTVVPTVQSAGDPTWLRMEPGTLSGVRQSGS